MKNIKYNIAYQTLENHLNQQNAACISLVASCDGSRTESSNSYLDLSKLSNQFANVLIHKGLRDGDRFMIRLPQSVEAMIAFIGAIKIGVIPVPTSVALTPSQLNVLCEKSGARLLLTHPSFFDEDCLAEGLGKVESVILMEDHEMTFLQDIDVWQSLMNLSSDQVSLKEVMPSSVAFWHYPEQSDAVVFTHENINNQNILQTDEHIHRLLSMSAFEVLDTLLFLEVWRRGGTVCFYQGTRNTSEISHMLSYLSVDCFIGNSQVYDQLTADLESNKSDLMGVRHFISVDQKIEPLVRVRFKEVLGQEILTSLPSSELSRM